MRKAVLFDLDGVIVDTALFHYRGWKRLADELGVSFDEQANEKLRGVPRRESLLAMLGYTPSEDKIQEYMDRKNRYYLDMVTRLRPADTLPGVRPLLAALRKAGLKIALASSSKNARLVLKRLQLEKAFDAVVDGNDIQKGKPDPELFITSALRLGAAPQDCLVVEDAASGIEAGAAAGMHTLGVGKPESLGQAERVVSGLDHVSLADILHLLEGAPVPADPALHPVQTALKDSTWCVEEKGFRQPGQALYESLFALANGTIGVRGSVEEHDLPYPDSRPGTFMAGVFDAYESWYQAIVNLPFPFITRFRLNGQAMSMTRGKVKNYRRELDMYRGILTRSFVWQDATGKQTAFTFRRLVSLAEPHLAAMEAVFQPLNWSGSVEIENQLDAGVDNIDFHKGGYQLRPERYYFVEPVSNGSLGQDAYHQVVRTKRNPHQVAQAVRLRLSCPAKSAAAKTAKQITKKLSLRVKRGQAYRLEKMVGFAATREGVAAARLVTTADAVAKQALAAGFETAAAAHAAAWCRRWRAGDVVVDGHASDQQALRFSIFHLVQFANPRDNRVNIGSRGLTAEMHYGNCFWDTELFIMPFYIYTWPESARALAEYRYQTLPEARNKAKRLFFRGAMFPWMSSYPGKEQADYWEYANIAVHIVGDVHYALEHYHQATGDQDFMDQYGAEIVLEIARFWQSRSYDNPRRNAVVINTVKGPNEYDGVVHNNTYTNWHARYCLRSGLKLAETLKAKAPKRWQALAAKLKLTEEELASWKKAADRMFINYDPAKKLYIEDDSFLDREPFDMKALKPGKKIITELGVSWDTLLRLNIVKQADVLLLMALFPDDFTREQKEAAWNFYEPKTCHDSSLSYNTHAIMAAQLDRPEEALKYWDLNARLDLDDTMENSYLGVHSACVGGTWQAAVMGFAGMRLRDNGFAFTPKLPKRWKGLRFKLLHRNRWLEVSLNHRQVTVTLAPGAASAMKVTVGDRTVTVQPGQRTSIGY
ncbi:MAG: beta-phosphoglucomutase [candidate division FCPU426 bacterium]